MPLPCLAAADAPTRISRLSDAPPSRAAPRGPGARARAPQVHGAAAAPRPPPPPSEARPGGEEGIEWASVERATETEKGGTPLRLVIRRMEEDGVDAIPADVVVQKYTNPFMFFVSVAFTTEEEIERLAKEDETREEDDERANPQVGF